MSVGMLLSSLLLPGFTDLPHTAPYNGDVICDPITVHAHVSFRYVP